MRSIKLVLCAAALLGSVQVAEGQNLSIEARGGAAIPTGEWNEDDEVETGFGFGGNVRVNITPMVAIYGGWEMYQFAVDTEGLGDVDADLTDKGFRAGAELTIPMPAYPSLMPFVELGATYNTTSLELSDDDASLEVESDATLGGEAGVGVAFALSPNLSVTPAVRFRTHDADFDDGQEALTVSYFVFDIGLRLRL
jgi:opacity protein-like surface antigen